MLFRRGEPKKEKEGLFVLSVIARVLNVIAAI